VWNRVLIAHEISILEAGIDLTNILLKGSVMPYLAREVYDWLLVSCDLPGLMA
jgi:hypothetical protein